MSAICSVPYKVQDKKLSEWTISTRYHVYNISAECRVEYEIGNYQSCLFPLDQPKKCTMLVTFPLRAEYRTR